MGQSERTGRLIRGGLALVAVAGVLSVVRLMQPPQATEPVFTPATPTPTVPGVVAAHYPWLAASDMPTVRLDERFPAPEGTTRLASEPGSYAAWLRGLPIRTDRTEVRSYRGERVRDAAAVVMLDVGRGDLQQCADSIIRLHAEYLWAAGRAQEAEYHFTSGDASPWSKWRRGRRLVVAGSIVLPVPGIPRSNGHRSYRSWLRQVFRYAGTRSMAFESDAVGEDHPLEPGDFFVRPGSPGHVVLLLDVIDDGQGRRWGLIGQGYMPAQDFHVLAVPTDLGRDNVWYTLPGGAAPIDPRLKRELARRYR